MPFDNTTIRQPRVTVLPPIEPVRGEPPRQQIHIAIEILERRGSQRAARRGYRFGTLALVLLGAVALTALAGCSVAHAADTDAFRYGHWQDTNGWHGETRQQGRTTDWNAYGPRGEQKHCHQYYVGDQPMTSCN